MSYERMKEGEEHLAAEVEELSFRHRCGRYARGSACIPG